MDREKSHGTSPATQRLLEAPVRRKMLRGPEKGKEGGGEKVWTGSRPGVGEPAP
jgi:hypothetical protein